MLNPATSKILKVQAHAALIAVLCLAVSFSLFLGLQVDPAYGNIGLVVSLILVCLYIHFGFIRKK